MTYLTEKEEKMPLDFKLLQIVLGIQTCKTKGEVKDLLEEVYDLGKKETLQKVKEAWLKLKPKIAEYTYTDGCKKKFEQELGIKD